MTQILKSPIRRPIKIPYEPLHTVTEDGKFIYVPTLARRLCLPADHPKLLGWNQNAFAVAIQGNPWWSTGYAILSGKLGQTLINSGTSAYLHLGIYTGKLAQIEGRYYTYCNWSHDKALNKFSYEFFLNNDLEETDPTVIWDDADAFWTRMWAGSGSIGATDEIFDQQNTEQVAKGSYALKSQAGSGSYAYWYIKKLYASVQDWSDEDFLCLYWCGQNTGNTFLLKLRMVSDDDSQYRSYTWVDNWTGYKRLVIPINNPSATGGTQDLAQIKSLLIYTVTADDTTVYYLDRIVVDVGQWVKVEAWITDVLRSGGTDTSYQIQSWTGAAWETFGGVYADGQTLHSLNNARMHFLDGTTQDEILPTYVRDGLAVYAKNEKEEVESPLGGYDPDAGDITYSPYYGCLKRIGFAVKMPPDDGQDASDAGISQCLCKLEVYYDAVFSKYLNKDLDGLTTYEFKNDDNQYYGLENWNERWLALFDETTKTVEFLMFSERPTSLKIRADEDELIDMIEIGLPAGAQVWLGELISNDLTRDISGSGVPDFLDDPDEGLVLHLTFEEGEGIVAHDHSGEGNTGALGPEGSEPIWVEGGGLDFDGDNDEVDCGDGASLQITDEITIIASVKPTNIGEVTIYMGAFTYQDRFLIHKTAKTFRTRWRLEGGGYLYFDLTPALTEDDWNDIALTYIDSTGILTGYLDGVQGTENTEVTRYSQFRAPKIGITTGYDPFEGIVKRFLVYTRILSVIELGLLKTEGRIRYASIPLIIPKRSW